MSSNPTIQRWRLTHGLWSPKSGVPNPQATAWCRSRPLGNRAARQAGSAHLHAGRLRLSAPAAHQPRGHLHPRLRVHPFIFRAQVATSFSVR